MFKYWTLFVVIFTIIIIVGLVEPQQKNNFNISRPQYPECFDSQWDYTLIFPDSNNNNSPVTGLMRWSKLGDMMYYNISALDNFEQIVKDNIIYNFYRNNQTCYLWIFDFPIVQNYFQNVSFVGLQYDVNLNNNYKNSFNELQAEWIGQLNTKPVFNKDTTFIVHTNTKNGYVTKYIAANVVFNNKGQPGSEILTLKSMELTIPNKSLFVIPPYCSKQKRRED
ncbi:hypothetical protein ABK040_003120 [Willaertia magna]